MLTCTNLSSLLTEYKTKKQQKKNPLGTVSAIMITS